VKLTTWNINSVRLRLPLLQRLITEQQPDVICLQETKCADEFFPRAELAAAGYQHQAIWGQKSYNGVAILSRSPLTGIETHTRCGKDDCRHISARVNGVEIHNAYIPAGGYEPDPVINPKFQHKLDFVDELAAWWPQRKDGAKILVGDLNIAPLEHDVWDSKKMHNVVSHTPAERTRFAAMQKAGNWHDAVRHFHPPDQKLYTWWTYRQPDWEGVNKGRRLDHIWVTPDLVPQLKSAQVVKPMRGMAQPSDHIPVMVEL
jgi:exodeoxyribonuclease-3